MKDELNACFYRLILKQRCFKANTAISKAIYICMVAVWLLAVIFWLLKPHVVIFCSASFFLTDRISVQNHIQKNVAACLNVY